MEIQARNRIGKFRVVQVPFLEEFTFSGMFYVRDDASWFPAGDSFILRAIDSNGKRAHFWHVGIDAAPFVREVTDDASASYERGMVAFNQYLKTKSK